MIVQYGFIIVSLLLRLCGLLLHPPYISLEFCFLIQSHCDWQGQCSSPDFALCAGKYSYYCHCVFPRPGFVVGQAGLYQGIGMFLVAYFIICMTVLSVCAVSTNGALDAGGAYCIHDTLIVHINHYACSKCTYSSRCTSSCSS